MVEKFLHLHMLYFLHVRSLLFQFFERLHTRTLANVHFTTVQCEPIPFTFHGIDVPAPELDTALWIKEIDTDLLYIKETDKSSFLFVRLHTAEYAPAP